MDYKKKRKGGKVEEDFTASKKERELSKKMVEYRFENLESFLNLLEEGSFVFYHSQGMVSDSSLGSIDFKYQFESDNGTIIVYYYKFKKNHKNRKLCSDDVLLKYMEKYPKINFIPGTIKVR